MRCCLVLLCFLICEGVAKANPSSSSRIAAIVNSNIISQADLNNRLKFAAISSGLEPTPRNMESIKPEMLRVMIDEQLQREMGEKLGLEISKEHIQSAIEDIEENNDMPKGTIAQMMRENQIPLKTLEDQMKAQLIWLVYIREKYPLKSLEDSVKKKRPQEFTPSLQIADWEIDQELKIQQEKETKPQYHLAEILLAFDHPDQEEKVKANLNNLIEELQKGAHFSALAQQFSASASSSQGGDMGWLTEDQLESEVKEAISHMEPGQLSAPIRTSQGYTLIAFIEKKSPGNEGQSLITMQQVMLPFPENATEDQAREIMSKGVEISRKAKSCPDLEKIAKDKFPSSSARLLKNSPMTKFPEALQEIVNNLNLNQASDPLLIPEGGLIVMVCERTTEKKEEFTREDAKQLIASRKHALLARRELRDLRRHAFIDVRM